PNTEVSRDTLQHGSVTVQGIDLGLLGKWTKCGSNDARLHLLYAVDLSHQPELFIKLVAIGERLSNLLSGRSVNEHILNAYRRIIFVMNRRSVIRHLPQNGGVNNAKNECPALYLFLPGIHFIRS